MPVEFLHETGDNSKDYKLLMAYDGSGRRISKTRYSKNVQYGYWTRDVVTHYTGIGTEVREAMRRSASPKTTVVVNLPQGLGRYLPEDAEKAAGTAIPLDKDGNPVYVGEMTPEFEWYLKNHLGSTMLVYGTQPYNDKYSSYAGGVKAAYDYRAFGEQVDLAMPTDKVTENFTGKEKDDETELNYFGARYLDPMLGMWISVDPKRQFTSPYLYVGNGMNPIGAIDPDGTVVHVKKNGNNINYTMYVNFTGDVNEKNINTFVNSVESFYTRKVGNRNISMKVVVDPELAENTIVFIDKKGQSISSRTFGDNYNKNYNEATIFMLNDGNGMKSSIHEAGHLMGMKDRYVKINGVNVVDEGYEGNMMGDKGDGLHPIQIDETLQKKGNTYENFDPYNGD